MKEQAIKKINGIGKAGQIISNIGKVILIIATVALVAASITIGRLVPKDSVIYQAENSVALSIDAAAFGRPLSDEDRAKLEEGNTDWVFTLDGNALSPTEISGDIIRYTSEAETQQGDVRDLARLLIVLAVLTALMTVAMFCASAFFKALRHCESPFEERVLVKMKYLAYSLIPWGLVSIGDFDMTGFMLGKPNIVFSVNVPMILVVLVVIALMVIFRYGAMLQQESDETL